MKQRMLIRNLIKKANQLKLRKRSSLRIKMTKKKRNLSTKDQTHCCKASNLQITIKIMALREVTKSQELQQLRQEQEKPPQIKEVVALAVQLLMRKNEFETLTLIDVLY